MVNQYTEYDACDCTVMVNSLYITNLSEEMVKCAKDEDYFSTQVGAQGAIVKNVINNPLGTITITVQGTCPQAAYLIGLANSGEKFPIWIINKKLGRRIGGSKASVRTAPELSEGKEAGDLEFAFQVFDYTQE